jgi:hypothetical protein
VATVLLAYGYYRHLFETENFSQLEKEQWGRELYDGAIEITETVLYVKQHSVNCIPAAIYLVVKNFEEWISVDDGRKFIKSLFLKPEGFSDSQATEIRNYILNSYEKYLIEGEKSEHWYEPLWNFLLNYGNSEGFPQLHA